MHTLVIFFQVFSGWNYEEELNIFEDITTTVLSIDHLRPITNQQTNIVAFNNP